MAWNAYVTIKGQKQGNISGSVTQKGHESSILVHTTSHEIDSPRDAASGLPTGKRMHKPFTFVKDIDKSSPLLWSVIATNETLTTVQIQFWQPAIAGGSNGIEREVYSITLTNASMASMREVTSDTADPSSGRVPMQEEISLVYQKIQWTWADGGITSSDDWEAPVV